MKLTDEEQVLLWDAEQILKRYAEDIKNKDVLHTQWKENVNAAIEVVNFMHCQGSRREF